MSEDTSELPLEFEFTESTSTPKKKTARKTAKKKTATKKATTRKRAAKKVSVSAESDDVPAKKVTRKRAVKKVAKKVAKVEDSTPEKSEESKPSIKIPHVKLEDEVPSSYSSDSDVEEAAPKKDEVPEKQAPRNSEDNDDRGHDSSGRPQRQYQKKDRYNKKRDFKNKPNNNKRDFKGKQNPNQNRGKPQNQNPNQKNRKNNRFNQQNKKRVRAEAFGIEEGVAMDVGSLAQFELLSDFEAMIALATEQASVSDKVVDFNKLAMMPLMDLVDYAAEEFEIVLDSAPIRQEILELIFRKAAELKVAIEVEGILETNEQGYGLLVYEYDNYRIKPLNTFISSAFIKRYGIKRGHIVKAQIMPSREDDEEAGIEGETTPYAIRVISIMGKDPEENLHVVPFEDLTPYYPLERLLLETSPTAKWDNISMRTVDLLTPIGKGQRGLIVAPPRTGKTVLQQGIANSILENNPEAHLIILLVDERPEEVTDFRRQITRGEVIASTFDETPESHVHAAEMVIAKARRMVESGEHVVILLDSITRLARAYNALAANSGKILSGGVEANALQRPKRFFGSARNIEGGGSLTILGTALVETGSRMDEVIFEEFKGTGNMELHLDRALIDKRIFPAISLEKSGTRKEELLYHPDEMRKVYGLRRAMKGVPSTEAMEMLINRIKKTKTNAEFLMSLQG
jgi:transcription termination factor Rho